MGIGKISSADTTDMTSNVYTASAAAQGSTIKDFYAVTTAGQTTEGEYQNTLFLTQMGVYNEISEFAGMIDRKAQYVVGKGFKIKGKLKGITQKGVMEKWRGNGLDSANMIFYNAVRTYTIGGDFFAEIVRNRRNKITNLKPLNPSTVKVVANNKGIIKKYVVFPIEKPAGKQVTGINVDPKNMFHLAYNRIADQIHGQSVVDKLMPIIEMRREAMQDIRVVFHRYVKPLWVFSVDTDDTTELAAFKVKVDKTIEKCENLIVPKDTVSNIERIAIPQYSTLDPLPWLKLLQFEFLKAEGVPGIVMGVGGEATEAESKMLYLSWQQVVEFNQKFLEEQIKLQLNLDVEFEFPVSIAPELTQDANRDGPAGAGSPPKAGKEEK